MNKLAHTYKNQNRIEKATELMKKVAERGTKVMGAKHSSIVGSKQNLELWEEELKGGSKEELGKISEAVEDKLEEESEKEELDGKGDSKREI